LDGIEREKKCAFLLRALESSRSRLLGTERKEINTVKSGRSLRERGGGQTQFKGQKGEGQLPVPKHRLLDGREKAQ